MKRTTFGRILGTAALAGALAFGLVTLADAQQGGMGGGMMGGGMMGGGMGGGMSGPSGSYGYRNGPAYRGQGLDTRGGRLFAQTCSQCHGLPDPRQHTAAQWPDVVARMERHMNDARMALPDRQAIEAIDAFLERRAGGGR